MRVVPLKTLDMVDSNGMPGKFTYANVALGLVKGSAQGTAYNEVDLVLEIEAAIEAAQAKDAPEVILEEAQYQLLAERVRSARWTWVTRELREFFRDVLQAEKFDANAVEDPLRIPVVNNRPLAAE